MSSASPRREYLPTDYNLRFRDCLIGAQMLFVAFGALVLVPILTGLDSNVALFTAGVGTLLFQVCTRGKVPIFLASSFAFIAPIIYGVQTWGMAQTLGGLVFSGFVYFILSGLIRWRGIDVVLRVLASHKPLPLEQIGLSTDNLAQLRAAVHKSYGLILVCGPTGSGKTTTLHSVVREINTPERKIWTAENPIEITQEGLRQVEVNPRIGWTFAAAMRSFLRADPDVVMIGEMRDEETAGIAIEASLTGHLVLSTLHTNSAPESVARLLEIGMDPFTFSDALVAILAQRLVRKLCTHCRERAPLTADALNQLAAQYLESGTTVSAEEAAHARAALVSTWVRGLQAQGTPPALWRRVGCAQCDGTGYKGRMGIHELMCSDDAIRGHIRRRESAHDIRRSALRAGMKTLRQDGIDKVLQGLTDIQEVLAASNQ